MSFSVEFQDYRIGFDAACGGFPSSILLKLRNQETQEILCTKKPWLSIVIGGEKAMPYLPQGNEPKQQQEGDTVRLEYWNIPWKTESGALLPDFYLNLSYELSPDGVGFIRMAFTALSLPLPELQDFSIRVPMQFGDQDSVTYGYWKRPEDVTSSSIQAVNSFTRNATEKKDISFGNSIVPLVGFDFGKNGRMSRHIEWMMEGQNSIGADVQNVTSCLTWEAGEPSVEYRFVERPVSVSGRPYQWRNQMGFVLGQTPKVREKAPLRLYHYLDLYECLPTLEQVRKMAAEGADALILHEGWRTDLQNGGVPKDPEAFSAVVEECHRLGIRVMPYVRGSEPTLREELCSWFPLLLQKNQDGLYADYGGPIDYFYKDENYPGGRFGFKEHYRKMKELREKTIGKDGLFILHTGPFFSGSVLCSLIDGYTAGEGEKGVLLSSRRENAYFSETSLAPGALWTAAFPDYKTKKMLPYMANIGQYPHVTLGVQLKSSSLAHPREPGCVTFARPLWKLYGLMAGERNLAFSNDLCDETISCDSDETGACVFGMQDGAKLMLVSNFRPTAANCTVSADLFHLEKGQICYLCRTDASGSHVEKMEWSETLSVGLPEYGICGVLLCPNDTTWTGRLNEFAKPYPEMDGAEQAYFAEVEEMRKLRFEALPKKKQYLRVSIPIIALNWEDDVWWDLFNSVYEVYWTPDGGAKEKLGYLSCDGFQTERPEKERLLWPGQETPWIALHEILPKQKGTVELRANHFGEDFYSFLEAELCDEPGQPAQKLVYKSELDCDRARLTVAIHLE